MSRLGRSQPIPPFAAHGFVDPGPGPVGTTPANTVVIENDDRRRRTPPLQPVVINGLYATVLTLTVMPPFPTVAIFPDRPRSLSPLQPVSEHGFVDPGPGPVGTVPPPITNVDRVDQRVRYRPLDPYAVSAALLSVQLPAVLPTGPFVVPLTERSRLLAALPTISHGFVDPGTRHRLLLLGVG